jgi:hypothetical protein
MGQHQPRRPQAEGIACCIDTKTFGQTVDSPCKIGIVDGTRDQQRLQAGTDHVAVQ